MAANTKRDYRNQVMYCVYVRNHSVEGTFDGVRKDLDRIKALGVDIIWFMPIHPIGEKGHKGTLGCPYAIRDYRATNPKYGTMEDFKRLVDDIHAHDMKCIIDVVYNHTSPDSVLAKEHPEWFYRLSDGRMGNRVGEWSDVVDLDYSNWELWDYQIETLKMWAKTVDGFRCDVASLVPIDFWVRAREAVEDIRPGCIWLAESVEPEFIEICRRNGIEAFSDSEIYRAFDIAYDYDIFPYFQQYLEGELSLEAYAEAVNRQEWTYPYNYTKLRFLENHDRLRAAFSIPDEKARYNFTAFMYFQKGMTLIYAGQERGCSHRPSLFDKDTVDFSGKSIEKYMHSLYEIKKAPIFANGAYKLRVKPKDVVVAQYIDVELNRMIGIFGLKAEALCFEIDVPDGIYKNLIDGSDVDIQSGRMCFTGEPVIFEIKSH